MADKLGEQVPPPGVKREMKKWENLKAAPVTIAEGNEQATLTAQDVAELDADRPAVGISVTADEMGAMNPVYDRSENIEYWFYKCSYEHCQKGQYSSTPGKAQRKIFAEGREDARRETCECTCVVMFPDGKGGVAPKLKAYQNPKIQAPQYVHGEMKLYHFTAPRPKEVSNG